LVIDSPFKVKNEPYVLAARVSGPETSGRGGLLATVVVLSVVVIGAVVFVFINRMAS
jgi:hypothetical protein